MFSPGAPGTNRGIALKSFSSFQAETAAVNSRELEAALLARCAAAAREDGRAAEDRREANVFRLAAMVVQSRFPRESERLMRASERYFAGRPDDRLPPGDVVRNGWVFSLPRLREMLSRQLGGV